MTDFELSGYPIRIECGERDIEASNCVIVSRITQEKLVVSIDEINKTVDRMLEE
ncbi:MAG: hypothetical protein LBQ24_00215 [Candidatus Peribacteria bacterium]|nr:hypothetical protein [Candidatus Peribacteria bacterium]